MAASDAAGITSIETRSIVVWWRGERSWLTYRVDEREQCRGFVEHSDLLGEAAEISPAVYRQVLENVILALVVSWELHELTEQVPLTPRGVARVPRVLLEVIVDRIVNDRGAELEREELVS